MGSSDSLDGTGIQANIFVCPHLSFGFVISAQWISNGATAESSGSTSFVAHFGPRVGYDIAFSEHLSLWPQLGVDYRTESTSQNIVEPSPLTGANSYSSTTSSAALAVSLAVPFVVHPTNGFFVGAGPAFYTEFANGMNSSLANGMTATGSGPVTSIGLQAMIGGAI